MITQKEIEEARDRLAAEYVIINGGGKSRALDSELIHCFKTSFTAGLKIGEHLGAIKAFEETGFHNFIDKLEAEARKLLRGE